MEKNHNKFLWSFALCVQFLIFGGAWGQVANYSFSSSSGTYTAISGGTVVRSGSSLDAGGASVTLPTAFPFNGSSITSLRVNDDGYLALGVTSFTNSTQPIASTNAATGIVAALACDLMDANAVGTTPEIRWVQVGNEIIFQWNDFARYTSSTSVEIFDFQIRLNTSNGQIVIVFSNFSTVNSSTTYTPQVGLRGSTTADFNSRRLTTSVPTATPSWSNTAAATTTGHNVRFTSTSPAAFPSTGLTFTWTPPTPCTGTPTPGTIASNISQNVCSGSAPAALTVTGTTSGVTGITFQWEQSTDNATWANVSTGTGATTATYTPSAFGGTTIYYRCKVTCTGSSLFDVTNVATIAPPINPTTQASNLAFSSVSYTSFTASWTNGNGNRRVVFVSDAAITDPTNSTGATALTASTTYSGTGQQIVFDGTGTSVTITGLNLATTYYVKVIEYTRCGTTTYDNYYNVTSGTNSSSATTSAATPVPWTEGFATTTLPTNWVSTAGSVSSLITAVNPVLSSNYYYVNLWSSLTTAAITSPILGSIPTNYRFTVKYKLADYNSPYAPPASGSGNFIVAISTNNGTSYSDVETIANNAVAGWQDYTLNLSAYVGQNIRIRITGNWTIGDYFLAFDDFKIEAIPSCLAPSSPIVSSITNAGATLSWTAPATVPGSGYEVYYSTTNTAPTAGTTATATVTTGTSLAITSLTANTTYYAWVRSNCGSGDVSSWVASASFTTQCDPITSLPWTEGFEGVTVGSTVVGASTSLPSCWNSQSTQWSSTVATTYNTAKTGTKYLRYAYSSTNAYMWTPGFQLTAGVSYDFSFYAQGDGFTSWVNDVFVNSSVSAVGTTQLTPAYSPTGPGSLAIQSYNLVSRTFVPTTSGIYYFAIRGNESTGDPWYMAFDDFKLEETPACLVPTAPTISAITNAGATLSWTAPSTVPGSGYEVYYSTTNAAPTAGTTATETVATGTSLAIAGLSANTSYYAWVRSKCGSGDVSTWVASASFTTLQIPATLPYSDDLSSNDYSFVNGSLTNKWVFGSAVGNTGSSIYVSNDNGISNAYSNSSSTVAHAFRDITIPSGSTLANFSFDWIANGESGYDYLRVWIVPVSFVPSAGSEITSGSGRIQVGVDFIEQTTWQTYTDATLNVSSFANSTMRLVFEWSNDDVFGDNPPGAIDNVNLSIPLCLAPSAPIVSSITNVGATLSWTAPSPAPGSGYEVYYSATNTAPTAGTTPTETVATGTSLAIAGLTANTTYYTWVRSKCGSGDVSAWIASASFTTPCDPITSLPWTEGFEGVTVGNTVVGSSTSLPSCWNSQSTKWSSTDETTYNTSQTGTKYIRYAWSSTDAFIWTPGFQLTAGVSYDFSFYAQGDGFTSWVNDVFVNSSVSAVGTTQLTPAYSPTGAGSAAIQSYNLVSRTFVPTTSGIYYFAIRGNQSSSAPWYMAFDDFSLELTPSPLPTELVSFAANCEDNNTVAVNWTTASEHNSDYFIVEKSRNGSTWNELKKIGAAGNSSQLINYSVADASDINGTVYYRLSQYDIDGASKVYDIISTNCSAENELAMVAYPNPSNGQFTVKIENALGGKYDLTITDMQGKAIEQQNIQLETGTTVVKLNPIGLKPGVYLLQLVNAGTIEKQLKLVVN
jgi:hypothetical protein